MARAEVIHGDCLDVLRGMADASVDAVVTDPPYSSGGQFRGDRTAKTTDKYIRGGRRATQIDFTGDNRDQRSFGYWCTLWLAECRRVAIPGAPVVVFTDWRQLPMVTDVVQAAGWVWRGVGVWAKSLTAGGGARPAMGRFANASEFFVWGSNGPMPANTDVGCLPGVISTIATREERSNHVTAKPLDLMRTVVRVCPPGGTVLDPFAGSGTTLVAALAEGRSAIGIEQVPEYVEIARQRIAKAQEAAA